MFLLSKVISNKGRHRWEDNIRVDLKGTGNLRNWINLVKDGIY